VSVNLARQKRLRLYLSIAGLMLMVGAVSTISASDPDGVTLRVGMILVTVGAAMWLPWQALLPAVLVAWLGPNIGRNLMQDYSLFNSNMMWELPGLLGLAGFSSFARVALRELEEEQLLLGLNGEAAMGLDPQTGVYEESQLRISIEAELSRSRRFGRTFSLVLVGMMSCASALTIATRAPGSRASPPRPSCCAARATTSIVFTATDPRVSR